MADPKSKTTAENIARLAIEALLTGGSRGAAGILRGGLATYSGRTNDGTDGDYPHMMHTFRIRGQIQKTAMENRGNRILSGGMDKDYARMQSLEEHNNALSQYIRDGQNPRERHAAIMKGEEAEQLLPSYWNDKAPRKDFKPSSSAVETVRVTPDNRVEVKWRTSPTFYTFKSFATPYEASLAAQRLMLSQSIGRAVFPHKRRGGNTALGQWNEENYDGSMAP